ncbi:1-acyl-sn-glycerol-3-phosphate acyltransferase [Candidatus Protochlamydia sp. W-9]|uniref:1-acyl-sn-glycerol-3-phosphate acyltransferase n=1 Tax=Candidatus Protochlamydia sp. W-9 TaxID=1785087 RepID=UPI00096A28F3|nr:1-acyl-sn-glycerol-3-phosphate acyltransferase [Candidatus Protochlamydia sp. W-9]
MVKPIVDLAKYLEKGILKPPFAAIIEHFHDSYLLATKHSCSLETSHRLFMQLFELAMKQSENPYQFEIFHQSIRSPFDYYQFGLDFIRPLINFEKSTVLGREQLAKICQQMAQGDNVILLANHQTEPDPQILSLMLENIDKKLATEMIFIAGHRVISDPLAIPMSMGRNLLCIYSKKHISHPPEKKTQKVSHNQRTMRKMSELLSEGGRCIYVAPSGGRDRRNSEGQITIAPFDPQSLEMFWLMAQQADHPTHFYPLSLHTYDLMPPPKHVEKELGEKRTAQFSPVHLAFSAEIDMKRFSESEHLDKKTKRNKRAEFIWKIVRRNYELFN